jgi:hypothetical protein
LEETLASDGFLEESDGGSGEFLDEHGFGGRRFGDKEGFVGLNDLVDFVNVTGIVDLKIVDFFFDDGHLEQVGFGRGRLFVRLFGRGVDGFVFEFFEFLPEFGEFKGGVNVSDVLIVGDTGEPV